MWHLSVFTSTESSRFSIKQLKIESGVKLPLVKEGGGGGLIPGAPYVASILYKQQEMAAILKGVDSDHILSI